MKKVITLNVVIGAVVIALIYSACQMVIGTVAGIGSVIPHNLVDSDGYKSLLERTIRTSDDWDLARLKKEYKEEAIYKLKYLDAVQAVLQKLSKAHVVEGSK